MTSSIVTDFTGAKKKKLHFYRNRHFWQQINGSALPTTTGAEPLNRFYE